MAYKLYNRSGSGGFAVEAALALADVPHELILLESPVSTPLPESFREINPWGQTPVLIAEDGTTVTETSAILIWLAGRHTRLGPEPWTSEHAQFLRWMVFLSANVYESVLRQIYPHRYVADVACVPAVVEAAVMRNKRAFDLLEDTLAAHGGTLLGGPIGAADILVAMLALWHRRHQELPHGIRLARQVAAHPAIAPVWRRNFGDRLERQEQAAAPAAEAD